MAGEGSPETVVPEALMVCRLCLGNDPPKGQKETALFHDCDGTGRHSQQGNPLFGKYAYSNQPT